MSEIVPAEVAAVRPGEDLDWPTVEAYLREHVPELEGDFEVRQFPNGAANLTYFLQFGDRPLVLRRPPFGRLAPGAHDMAREHRVLSRLWRAYPAAPRALLFCEDEAVAGSKFFVMEYRPGVVIWDVIPPSMAHHADVGRRVGMAVIHTLADLHGVDPDSCDLSTLGKPDGFVARQVSGWRQRWELVAPDAGLAAMNEAAEQLEKSQPRSQRATILHNDLKLDNCQFDPEVPDQVHSVFDWDMATLGDPLVDFGTILNYWPDPSDGAGDKGVYHDGMATMGLPTHAEIIAEYAHVTGLDLSGAGWYQAFACWKTAVVLQQLYTRYVRGESTDPRMATRGERVGELAERTLRLLRHGAAA